MRRLLLALLIACGAPPHPAPLEKPTIDAAKLDAALTPWIATHGAHWGDAHAMSGYVIVAQHDQPVYAHAFGYADREHQVPADADTSFRIGSITKQFTAAAILVLQQDGKLSTKDPISKYLPDYPAVGAGITLHQLLTHTTGIPDFTALPGFAERDKPLTVAQLLELFDHMPLEFAPGSRFAYSNSNYEVLGAIIEKVSGMSYADFVAKRLFAPAGLTHTVIGDDEGDRDRALGYTAEGDALVPAHAIDMSVAYAAGAARSTANDLVRWHRALAGDAILSEASKRELYTPDHDDYAYGWFVDQVDGHTEYSHSGGIDGFAADYRRIPDLDLVIVALSNNESFDVGSATKAAEQVALGKDLPAYREAEKGTLDTAAAARIAGDWKLDDSSRADVSKAGLPDDAIASIATITMLVSDGKMFLKPVGQGGVALEASSPTTYFSGSIGVTVTVTLPDDGGPATKLVINQHGLVLTYSPQR